MTNSKDAMSRDQLLLAWIEASKALEQAKTTEHELRMRIASSQFPNAKEGTNTLDLGNSYKLKMKLPYTYNLSNSADSGYLTQQALGRLLTLDKTDGAAIAKRLVHWKPTLSLREWAALPALLKQAFTHYGETPALVIKPGMPQLEIVEPAED